jgi:hypothetical protein
MQTRLNPNAVLLIAFCTVIGALLGAWLIGLAVGLGIVLLASVLPSGGPR